ncbi:MAG: hypothetical protein Q9170_008038, partial [Blastenia crenularia]
MDTVHGLSPSHSKVCTSFYHLPPELRIQIYNYVLDPPLLQPRDRALARRTTLSLLQTSKLINHEFSPLFHKYFAPYTLQIDQDGPWYISSPNITKWGLYKGVSAPVPHELKRWVVEVRLSRVHDRSMGKRERKWEIERRTRGIMTWLRGWCIRIAEAGVELERLEVRVVFPLGFLAVDKGLGLLRERGIDFLAPLREVRAKECVVRGILEGGALRKWGYGDGVAEAVVRGVQVTRSERLQSDVQIFDNALHDAINAFDPILPCTSNTKRKALAAIRSSTFLLPIGEKLDNSAYAYDCVVEQVFHLKARVEEDLLAGREVKDEEKERLECMERVEMVRG